MTGVIKLHGASEPAHLRRRNNVARARAHGRAEGTGVQRPKKNWVRCGAHLLALHSLTWAERLLQEERRITLFSKPSLNGKQTGFPGVSAPFR